ncbi:MAG: sugar lactone lactonase YvrE [Verrucomicrobiales bacterium]|jgi:sugar lactone lactonase YvrE
MNLHSLILVSLIGISAAHAAELSFEGVIANSGDSGETLATFSEKPACGIGPVLDADNTIWERGGSTQLNHYALDGRLLATFELPDFNNKLRDQMTLAGQHLLFLFGKDLYRLSIEAEPGTKAERIEGNAEVLSSSAFLRRVAIFDAGEVLWLDGETGARTSIVKTEAQLRQLFVDEDGVVFGFANEGVFAWKDGKPLAGYPRSFGGARVQKIGDFWYSHGYHGTIHRYNAQFDPDPGVVLGGASGSFIGYLPRSVDIEHGAGLVHVRDDLFAVSGTKGVVQLLQWQEAETQFKVVRRIGPMHGLTALALDASGAIWTPKGSLRWANSSETPFTLGDVEPYHTTQPVVLGGKTVCFLKNHYGNTQKSHGPFIDESGWAHLESRGIRGGFTLSETIYASTAFTNSQGQLRLLATEPDGKAMEFSLSADGHIGDNAAAVTLPGLESCTSLAWFAEHLLAADRGAVVVLRQSENGWQEVKRIDGFGDEIFIHSDGKRFVVSDAANGRVQLFDSLEKEAVLASFESLVEPKMVAVSGDRVIVLEAGKQRLVKLQLGSGGVSPPSNFSSAARRRDATATNNFTDADFYELGRPGGIPIAVAVSDREIAIRVPDNATKFKFGVANGKDAFIIDGSNAQLPAGDWSSIRLAVSVELPNQRERTGFTDHQPIHASFSEDPLSWAPFDLTNYRELVAERKEQIRVEFTQPLDGKASLVIENEAGDRVRNLVSGRDFRAGKNTAIWDGLDENGMLVSPGNYRWSGVAHPGIKPEFRMTFAGGGEDVNLRPWGPNHGLLQHAVSNGEHIFFAAPVTEGGWALLALDADGNFVQGYEHQQGFGIGHNAIAVDEKYLYCAQDGFGWGGSKDVDWNSDNWKATWTLTVSRYDLKTGKVVEFPGKQRAFVADTMEVGPGSAHPDLKSYNLGGLSVANGRIYVGSRDKDSVLVFDAETGEGSGHYALKQPRHLATAGEHVYAASDDRVVRLDDDQRIFDAGEMDLTGLTVAPNGDFLVSDGATHQVHRFSADGKRLGSIGEPGGPYKGAYDPERMVNPAGLAFGPDGKLWVTEKRWNPKRVMAWDPEKGAVVYEKFGIPHYGGDGSGFDSENARRWIGLGCFWDVDIDTGAAKPTHIMALDEGHFEHYHPHGYSFFREAGRRFLCARGKIALLLEVLEDGTLREIAAACGTHHFAYGCNWDPPQAYIDAFYAKWPAKRKEEKPGRGAQGKPWAGRVAGVLWVDRNDDGETQQDEFTFTEEGVKFADGAWGHRQDSLTFRFPAAIGEQVKIVEIKPRGFLANEIPDYPTLAEAVETSATDISLTPGNKRQGVSTARDRFGRFIFNSDPEMNAYNAEGKHLWSYPNQWSNVHGSHDAPLPETGVMQGAMAILGMAPFDDETDVFFLNGNHGRCFLLTSDGIYLDEAFTDVRVSYQKNEYRLGGEIFGGMFERSNNDGKYYVQIGHGPYRIYQLQGIAEAQRISSEFTVSQSQVEAAERGNLRKLAETQTEKTFRLPGEISWDQSGKFKVTLKAAVDGDFLHLTYAVQDPSPWINNGRDWTTLFATGDTVDLQIGVDPAAAPNRREPAQGDQRLMIAPHEGKAIAVLYQHNKPGGENPIEFTSPWRGAKVDHVQQLLEGQIEVNTSNGGYTVDAKIPLAALGLYPSEKLRADFGVTFGDAEGTETQLRSYWANPATMLVDDIPSEIMLHPNLWGKVEFAR